METLEGSLTRAREERERDVRQATEMAERNRAASEQANERVVEMHKSMLDDLRQRDERMRDLHTRYSAEQAEYQNKYTDAVRALEMKAAEATTLKRRLESLERYEEECKKLRTEVNEGVARQARQTAELNEVGRRAAALTEERDGMRQRLMVMENEVAVFKAEKQLVDAKEAIEAGASGSSSLSLRV